MTNWNYCQLGLQNLSITDHSERKFLIVRSKVNHPGTDYEIKIITLFTKFKILCDSDNKHKHLKGNECRNGPPNEQDRDYSSKSHRTSQAT